MADNMQYDEDGRMRPMEAEDLGFVLAWRNHPDVRRYMYTQHKISLEEHRTWFSNAAKDNKKHLLIYESNKFPFGFVNFNEIARGKIFDWSFHLAPDAPRGTGSKLGRAALYHVFTYLQAHKLCGQVLSYNERSINFHKRLGFSDEGVLREQYFDGQSYHSVFLFGLLIDEWQKLNC